ncbi:hypothetical protein BGV56_18760 [Burkholderia ubonensis]|nr:hypothetical protein BGV56_18760 [Burkholderia ubonensis]
MACNPLLRRLILNGNALANRFAAIDTKHLRAAFDARYRVLVIRCEFFACANHTGGFAVPLFECSAKRIAGLQRVGDIGCAYVFFDTDHHGFR